MKSKLAFLLLLLGLPAWLALGQTDSTSGAAAPVLSQPSTQAVESAAPAAPAPVLPTQPTPEAAPAASTNAFAENHASTNAVAGGVSAEASTVTGEMGAAPASASGENRGPLTLEQELPAAIQFLARLANLNIQFDPSLVFTNTVATPDGKSSVPIVSLRWDNVTAEDALQEVLDNYGLMLMINPKTGIGRVTRKGPTAKTTAILQLRHCSPTNVLEVVRSTFSGAIVSADMRTSQLVIVAPVTDMYAITNLVTRLDTPTKQVLIEARLLETAKNPSSIKGIDWSGTLQAQNFSFGNGLTAGTSKTTTPGDGAATTTTLPSGRTMTTTSSGSSMASQLITSIGAGGASAPGGISANTLSGFSPATAFLNADGVHAVLSFLNGENDTEVVATPRAVTADNEKATLSVTRAFPIFQITPGAANVAGGAQIQYTNLGTILQVTPRITANNNVALKVIPEVSNIDSKDQQIINGTVNQANVYAIRKIEADVVVPSGNTLVMGGLISDSSTKSFTKVPVLGDLPGVGLLFRRDSKTRNKVNLLIFVTPTIIQEQDFTPTPTSFLRTPLPERPDKEESAWDSGKPYDWSKGAARK